MNSKLLINVSLKLVFAVLMVASVRAQTAPRRFDLGPGKTADGFVRVTEADTYTEARGYGFEPGARVECVERDGKDALRSDFCTGAKPFFFSVAVPEGNYRVTVTLGDPQGASVTTVKAEVRRLMLERVETAQGKTTARSFVVNVRVPQLAGGGEVKLKDREKTSEIWNWDGKLTLEFNDERPAVAAVEVERVDNVPTVFLLGDSTVCDQPLEPYNSWGQMLTRFFGPQVAVANHAQSGESLRSSLGARRLDKVLSVMRPGDYLFIQFGHNDQKQKGEGVGAFTTYKAELKRFVAGARSKGGLPVLVTSMQRRTFDAAGKITNTHGDYTEAVRQAAAEEKTPLIDLDMASRLFYEALGPEKSKLAFKEGDRTHHNNYGSYEFAKMVVEGIKANRLGVARYLDREVKAFDPRRPDPVESFRVPASPQTGDVKPFGN